MSTDGGTAGGLNRLLRGSSKPDAAASLSGRTFVKAVNAADLEGLVCCFAEDALVNDQLSEYSGKPEIVARAMRDIIAENLTLFVLREVTSYNNSESDGGSRW